MTEWNRRKLCQGQRDIELNDEGRKEAYALSESLKTFSFSRICVSPLKRALETAKVIQEAIPSCKLIIIDELKERSWGELEGLSNTEMYRIEELEEKDPGFFPKSGVEERDLFKQRICRGMNAALRFEGEPLIVSHGRVFLSLCELLNIERVRQIPNTTLVECVHTAGQWKTTVLTKEHR